MCLIKEGGTLEKRKNEPQDAGRGKKLSLSSLQHYKVNYETYFSRFLNIMPLVEISSENVRSGYSN